MAETTTTIESDATEDESSRDEAGGEARWWCAEVEHALKERESWVERGRKVERAYHANEEGGAGGKKKTRERKMNVLWSNVQTLLPAVYMQTPKPVAARRWRQRDPVGRLASMLMERCLQVSCSEQDFHHTLEQAVRDRLLPGWGVVWEIYEPTLYDEQEIGADGQPAVDEKGEPITFQALEYERSITDYVRWDDYLTNVARTEDEVWWKARRHYFTKKKGKQRFGEAFTNVVMDNKRERQMRDDTSGSGPASREPRAVVWEIWDRDEGQVLFLAPGSGQNAIIEKRPAPYRLRDFFPTPRPLTGSTTSESTLPQPDYLQYQDQALEMNELTGRIAKMQRALKVAGLYARENKDIGKLLKTGEGEMIAVDDWAMHGESGGTKGQIEWYPVEKVIEVLRELYNALTIAKNNMYEMSGIADVMRGASDPNETLGAQKIKARWGSGRVRRQQNDVQRFAGEIFNIKAEIMAEVFQFETLLEMAGIDQEVLAKYVPKGMNPQMLLAQVGQMLKQDMRRNFSIKVEPDSTLEPDEMAERQWRTQFLQGMGAMLKELVPLVQQGAEGAKLAGEMMMLGVRGFKEADQIEETIEQAVEAAGKAAEQRREQMAKQGPPPDPKMAEVERKAKRDQAELMLDAEDRKAERAERAADRQQEQQEFQVDTQFRLAELRMDRVNGMAEAAERDEMAEAIA
ncbi:hypothetical protein [Vitreimonas flagellata]|uniref:hypothetical protein n=1 Tax=Vitreimonas flagellata TaxID=2560861 RepID=UPI0010758466|nr:hypothetical protein [Vitreimonas flagellata]